jgi:hypothetical protein
VSQLTGDGDGLPLTAANAGDTTMFQVIWTTCRRSVRPSGQRRYACQGHHRRMLGQRRFADPQLPDQMHHLLRTTSRRRHRRGDGVELPLATNQHRLSGRAYLVIAHATSPASAHVPN